MAEAESVFLHRRWRERNTKNVLFFSIPGDPSRHEAYARCMNSLDLRQIERFGRLKVPSFQLITYDNLVEAYNQIVLQDRFSSAFLRKLEGKLLEVLPQGPKLMIAYTVSDKPMHEYLEVMEWDTRKYPEHLKISEVVRGLTEELADMQDQFNYYNTIRRDAIVALEAFTRKATGTVATRDMYNMIPDETYIFESKNLTTLFVVVPKHLSKLWSETYEHITQLIVPGSSRLMGSDADYDLYNLIIWRAGSEAFREFITTETELTFRIFYFDIDEFNNAKSMEDKLYENEKTTTDQLTNWLRINLRKSFLHTVHVKLMRLHVESLIRYGIPFRFQIMFILPERRNLKWLTKKIDKMHEDLKIRAAKKLQKKKTGIDLTFKTYPFTSMVVYSVTAAGIAEL